VHKNLCRYNTDGYHCLGSVVFYEFFMSIYVVSALGCRKWHLQPGTSLVFFICNNVKVAIPFVFFSQAPHDLFTTNCRIEMCKNLFFSLGHLSGDIIYNSVRFCKFPTNMAYQIRESALQHRLYQIEVLQCTRRFSKLWISPYCYSRKCYMFQSFHAILQHCSALLHLYKYIARNSDYEESIAICKRGRCEIVTLPVNLKQAVAIRTEENFIFMHNV
jgi:hypothetical protein